MFISQKFRFVLVYPLNDWLSTPLGFIATSSWVQLMPSRPCLFTYQHASNRWKYFFLFPSITDAGYESKSIFIVGFCVYAYKESIMVPPLPSIRLTHVCSLQPPGRTGPNLKGWFHTTQEPHSFDLLPKHPFPPDNNHHWFYRPSIHEYDPCLRLPFFVHWVLFCRSFAKTHGAHLPLVCAAIYYHVQKAWERIRDYPIKS